MTISIHFAGRPLEDKETIYQLMCNNSSHNVHFESNQCSCGDNCNIFCQFDCNDKCEHSCNDSCKSDCKYYIKWVWSLSFMRCGDLPSKYGSYGCFHNKKGIDVALCATIIMNKLVEDFGKDIIIPNVMFTEKYFLDIESNSLKKVQLYYNFIKDFRELGIEFLNKYMIVGESSGKSSGVSFINILFSKEDIIDMAYTFTNKLIYSEMKNYLSNKCLIYAILLSDDSVKINYIFEENPKKF